MKTAKLGQYKRFLLSKLKGKRRVSWHESSREVYAHATVTIYKAQCFVEPKSNYGHVVMFDNTIKSLKKAITEWHLRQEKFKKEQSQPRCGDFIPW